MGQTGRGLPWKRCLKLILKGEQKGFQTPGKMKICETLAYLKKSAELYVTRAQASLGFPGGSAVRNLPAMQEAWVRSLGPEDPLKVMAAHSSIVAGNSMGRGVWRAKVHGVTKEYDMTQ